MVEIMKSDRSSERYEALGNSGGNQQMHPLSSANPPNLPRPPIHPSQRQQPHPQQHNHHMVQQQQPQSTHPLQHNNHGMAPHNHNLSSIHLNSTPGTARASQNQQQANGSGLGAKYEELVMSNSASTATNHHHHHHHHNNSPLQRPPPPMHHANGGVNGEGRGYGMTSVSDSTGGSGGGITPGGNISANGVTVVNGQPPVALEPGYAAEQENEKWWWVCCLEFCFCLL